MSSTTSTDADVDTATATTADTADTGIAGHLRTLAAARAASRDGRWPEAAGAWARIVAENPVHGGHWDAYAEACFESGDFPAARAAYQRVEDLGVCVDERETTFAGGALYRIAQCEARLGDADAALAHLVEAKRRGLRDPGRALADPCFAALRGTAGFQRFVDAVEPGDRVAGWRTDIAHLVAEARRRSPIWHRVGPAVESAAAGLAATVADLTDVQVLAGMLRVLRFLEDGHAFLLPGDGPVSVPAWRRLLPVAFTAYPDGLAITATDPVYAPLLGARVLTFGGRAPHELIAAVEPLISRDNDQWVPAAAAQRLRRLALLHAIGAVPDPDSVTLTVEHLDGSTGTVVLTTVAGAPARWIPAGLRPAGWAWLPPLLDAGLPLSLRDVDRNYWFEHVAAQDLVYFRFGAIQDEPDESIADCAKRLTGFIAGHGVRHLVVDLRWNGGGNTLLAEELVRRIAGCEPVNRPGGLFVIVGRDTFSAAQNTATLLERNTHAIFVGEPTGSRPNFVGETVPFRLPYSGLEANIADLEWQTSYPFDRRTWIAPTLYAPPTLAAYRANRDPALEAIGAALAVLPELA